MGDVRPALTSAQIASALRCRWPSDKGWLTLEQVAEAPGWEQGRLDLVAVGCWGSNACHTIGVEIKASLSDWRRELSAPGKRKVFVEETNEFWFAAPTGLIPASEVPTGCGLLCVGESLSVTAKVRAQQRAHELSPAFLTAIFKAALRERVDEAARVRRERSDVAEFAGRRIGVEDLLRLAEKRGKYVARREAGSFQPDRAERKKVGSQHESDMAMMRRLALNLGFGRREGVTAELQHVCDAVAAHGSLRAYIRTLEESVASLRQLCEGPQRRVTENGVAHG